VTWSARGSAFAVSGVSDHLGVAGPSALPPLGFVWTLKVEER